MGVSFRIHVPYPTNRLRVSSSHQQEISDTACRNEAEMKQTFHRRVDVSPQNIMKTLRGCNVAGQQQQQFNSLGAFSLSRLLHEASCRHRGGIKPLLIEHLFRTSKSVVLVCLFFLPSSLLLLLFSMRAFELDPAMVPVGKKRKKNRSRFQQNSR